MKEEEIMSSGKACSPAEVEEAKQRCAALRDQTLPSLPSTRITNPARLTLHRLLSAELRFLYRLSSTPPDHQPPAVSLNLGYLDALLRAIQHPAVHHVTRLCKPVAGVHVDLVCTFARSPAWILVSDRNPSYILLRSSQSHSQPNRSTTSRNLGARLDRVFAAARSAVSLKPAILILVFARGVADDVARELAAKFGAAEVDFLGFGRAFEIKIGEGLEDGKVEILRGLEVGEENEKLLSGGVGDGDGFGCLVSSMRPEGGESVEMLNFDTTALVALVSGISNGGCERLLKAPEAEMRARFKGNYEFVIGQGCARQSFRTCNGTSNNQKDSFEEQSCLWNWGLLACSYTDCKHGICKSNLSNWDVFVHYRT